MVKKKNSPPRRKLKAARINISEKTVNNFPCQQTPQVRNMTAPIGKSCGAMVLNQSGKHLIS
jgi:hypothetical protein